MRLEPSSCFRANVSHAVRGTKLHPTLGGGGHHVSLILQWFDFSPRGPLHWLSIQTDANHLLSIHRLSHFILTTMKNRFSLARMTTQQTLCPVKHLNPGLWGKSITLSAVSSGWVIYDQAEQAARISVALCGDAFSRGLFWGKTLWAVYVGGQRETAGGDFM